MGTTLEPLPARKDLARLNLNHQRLPQPVRDALAHTGIAVPSRSMFESIVARSIEIYFAVLEAIRILEAYVPRQTPNVPVTPRAGTGTGAWLIALETGCAESDDALSGEVRAALPALLKYVEACVTEG